MMRIWLKNGKSFQWGIAKSKQTITFALPFEGRTGLGGILDWLRSWVEKIPGRRSLNS